MCHKKAGWKFALYGLLLRAIMQGICLNLGKVDIRNPLCCLSDSAKK